MDIGKIIDDSFEYAKEGLVRKWKTWVMLIISCFIFPLYMGYAMRVYRGEKPAPQFDSPGTMFTDGIRLFLVGLIYTLPVLIVCFVLFESTGTVRSSVNPSTLPGLILVVFIGAIFLVFLTFLSLLIFITAGVRFARTTSFGEAFNFGAIFAHIGRIGWMTYLIALLMILISLLNIVIICMVFNVAIPYSGSILVLLLLPFIGLASPRYIALLYESAGTV